MGHELLQPLAVRHVGLAPETFLTWRALTSSTVTPHDSSSSNNGIQYTPVDSMVPVSTAQTLSQSARAVEERIICKYERMIS